MRTRTIMVGSFLAFGLAGGALLTADLSAPMPSALGETELEPARGSRDAKFQPQDGAATVQVRHVRDSPIQQATAVSRAACPRCRIGD